jgi:glutaredoxin
MKDIIVLTKANCPMCKRLKKEFERNGIIYREFDAENDTEGMAYVHFYGLSGSILPRVVVNDDVIPPYDTFEETVEAVLKYIKGPSYTGRDPIESY